MKDRIAQILQKENMTSAQFAEKIGISPSSLSHILGGRNKPSLEVIMKIHKTCDYINLNWLLYGEGNMETSGEPNVPSAENNPSFGISLFSENEEFADNPTASSENRKEIEDKHPVYPAKEIVREEIKYIERPAKKITEIRIFFDNGTYETFKPAD